MNTFAKVVIAGGMALALWEGYRMGLPRGIRNNNPGNLVNNGIAWQGLRTKQTDKRFYQFVSPEWGIRALAMDLLNDYRVDGKNTVFQLMEEFAPSSENNTVAYATRVAFEMGVGVHEPIKVDDPHLLPKMVDAIIKHENANVTYPAEIIAEGIQLAGVNLSYV